MSKNNGNYFTQYQSLPSHRTLIIESRCTAVYRRLSALLLLPAKDLAHDNVLRSFPWPIAIRLRRTS
jgi:hypothetical protein